MRRMILIALVAVVAALFGYLLAWPVPFDDPAAWTPPAAPPMEGPFALNDRLAEAEWFCKGEDVCYGPEDIAVGEDGRIYGGTQDGRVFVADPGGKNVRTLAETGGRPLGLHMDADGNLIVADAYKGLLRMDTQTGEYEVLTDSHGGKPFKFTDDLDIASDGTIYFTDASWKYPQTAYLEDLFEHRPHGRLLAYDPSTQETRQLLDGLYFANGVALAEDETFVLVNETWKYRVQRYWLSGPKQGTAEMFAENLPGVPDGISRGTGGRFWVAMFTPRNPALDKMLPSPFARKVVWRLPQWARPKAAHHAFVLSLDEGGEPVETLHDQSPTAYAPVTSVQEHGGYLYLGSLDAHGFARVAAP